MKSRCLVSAVCLCSTSQEAARSRSCLLASPVSSGLHCWPCSLSALQLCWDPWPAVESFASIGLKFLLLPVRCSVKTSKLGVTYSPCLPVVSHVVVMVPYQGAGVARPAQPQDRWLACCVASKSPSAQWCAASCSCWRIFRGFWYWQTISGWILLRREHLWVSVGFILCCVFFPYTDYLLSWVRFDFNWCQYENWC